jgi:prepilin-type N-terminal cleavage/methylation domain-containing protein
MLRRSHRRSGFTLLEVVISSALLGVVLGASMMITLSGKRAFAEGNTRARAEAKARRALERVVAELANAGIDALTPAIAADGTVSTATLTFDPLQSVQAGAAVWGTSTRIARVASPEDPNDGVDNDSDGLVDEGVITLTRNVGDADEFTYVLCSNVPELLEGENANGTDDNQNGLVDEAGLSIQRIGSMLTVRISVEEPGEGGTSVTATVTTSVSLRN